MCARTLLHVYWGAFYEGPLSQWAGFLPPSVLLVQSVLRVKTQEPWALTLPTARCLLALGAVTFELTQTVRHARLRSNALWDQNRHPNQDNTRGRVSNSTADHLLADLVLAQHQQAGLNYTQGRLK